ncbi:hypothetical protein [Streptomyces sp. NBC_00986]|uniref:hypothetical protein n=1 Tax=Streptomyces sp. NBC_00986 TaxID=2903702 RepID=UPI0038697706|nr:hypothetical protein OG504_06540 [Streptomyces sp. NBC_00986]
MWSAVEEAQATPGRWLGLRRPGFGLRGFLPSRVKEVQAAPGDTAAVAGPDGARRRLRPGIQRCRLLSLPPEEAEEMLMDAAAALGGAAPVVGLGGWHGLCRPGFGRRGFLPPVKEAQAAPRGVAVGVGLDGSRRLVRLGFGRWRFLLLPMREVAVPMDVVAGAPFGLRRLGAGRRRVLSSLA